MAQPYVGEIRMFAGNFVPAGWHMCDGSLLPIAENEVLFQLIGTTYGGHGEEFFALPNLNGRVPIGAGQGPGLSDRYLGETGGTTSVPLTLSVVPDHTHDVGLAVTEVAVDDRPSGLAPAVPSFAAYGDPAVGPTGSTSPALIGKGVPSTPTHTNIQPTLTFYFAITLQGVFPRGAEATDDHGSYEPPTAPSAPRRRGLRRRAVARSPSQRHGGLAPAPGTTGPPCAAAGDGPGSP